MLLSPTAVKKLKDVTAYHWPYYITHRQRNELARMFNEEAERLLDQKAESAVKHAVEIYSKGEIPYEQYIELIEQVSKEEAERGAAYGEEYARNRVFGFAQKALDQAKDQAHALSLVDAKRQYETEKQKSEQTITDIAQQYIATIETIIQKQKEDLIYDQESIIERTKTEIEQLISRQLQEERERQEREIHKQEDILPAREAARRAKDHVATLEKKAKSHKQLKNGLIGLGCVIFSLAIILLFSPLPREVIGILLVVVALIFVASYFWKSTISEDKVAEYKRQIALYQTKSDEYAALSEEERCALLAQRIL